MIITHVLSHGLALCGFTNDPTAHWPRTSQWVEVHEWEKANCTTCRMKAQKLEEQKEHHGP